MKREMMSIHRQHSNKSSSVRLAKLFALSIFLGHIALAGCVRSRKASIEPEKKSMEENNSTDSFSSSQDIPSSRPLDSGKPFRLGYSYDMLSGDRRASCLDPEFTLVARSLGSTEAEFSIISSKEDLAKKLNIEVNAEASGSYGTVSGSLSSKTQILKQANFTEQSIFGLFSLVYRSRELTIENDKQNLSGAAAELLQKSPADFRLQCGDAFSRSVSTGAAVYVIVELQSKSADTKKTTDTNNSVKAAFGGLFSASASAAISKEQQQMLQAYEIKMSCHSVGANSTACSQAVTDIDPNNFSPLLKYVENVKAEFSKSIESQADLFVSINEVLEEYPKPMGLEGKSRQEIFMDFSPQAAVVRELLDREIQINQLCNIKQLKSCPDLRLALAKQMRYCARQETWVDCSPSMVSLDKLLTEASATPVDQKIQGPMIGRNGGSPFSQFCSNYMVGLVGSSGAALDQTAATCDDGVLFPVQGTSRAVFYNVACSPGYVVTGLSAGLDQVGALKGIIGSLTLRCSNLTALKANPATQDLQSAVVFSNEEPKTIHWNCPAGFAAYGIAGAAATYVENMALLCKRY